MLTVADLKQGQKGTIQEASQEALPVKLLELGCLPGHVVKLVQIAPLNDPLYIEVDGSRMMIRRTLAQHIALKLIEDTTTP